MQASPPSSLSPELAAVRAQILEGRSDSALEQLARMPADAPPVRYLTGLAYYHRDDHVRAIEYLAPVAQTLAAGSLERREAVQVLGLSYYLAGRLREALPLLEETRQWARDNSELGHVLGLAYIQTQQPDKAQGGHCRDLRRRPGVGRGAPVHRAAHDPRRVPRGGRRGADPRARARSPGAAGARAAGTACRVSSPARRGRRAVPRRPSRSARSTPWRTIGSARRTRGSSSGTTAIDGAAALASGSTRSSAAPTSCSDAPT